MTTSPPPSVPADAAHRTRARPAARTAPSKPKCWTCSGPRPPLSPGQVRERLAEDLSYSTVVTIVSRLHAKGLLERERAGRAFVYRPVDDASRAASQMSQALQAGSDRGAVLSRFVSELSGRDARLLRNLLGEAGGELPGETGD